MKVDPVTSNKCIVVRNVKIDVIKLVLKNAKIVTQRYFIDQFDVPFTFYEEVLPQLGLIFHSHQQLTYHSTQDQDINEQLHLVNLAIGLSSNVSNSRTFISGITLHQFIQIYIVHLNKCRRRLVPRHRRRLWGGPDTHPTWFRGYEKGQCSQKSRGEFLKVLQIP